MVSKARFRGLLFITIYVILVLLPLLIVFVGPNPPRRDFLTEFSVALGFIGLSMIGLQFVITARVVQITSPFGMDVVLQFHRYISLLAVVLILLHPVFVMIADPDNIALLNIFTAPWRARFAVLATVLLLLIVVTSVWRVQVKLKYEPWRTLHSIAAVLVIVFSLAHVYLVAHYLFQPWKQLLWALMFGAVIAVSLYIRLIKPALMLLKPYKLVDVIERDGESVSLVIEPEGHPGIEFRPGQFAWITIGTSPFAMREHPFSFSSSAEEREQMEFTIKKLGDFTKKIDKFTPGERVYLDGPYGVFTPDRYEAPNYVLIAGGIGITPLLSILRTKADRGDKQDITLIYATKNMGGATFKEDLEDLEKRLNLEVVYVLEEPEDDWEGEEGRVDKEILEKYASDTPEETMYFICGPQPMMEAVQEHLEKLGVPREHVQLEQFEIV
jgi:predicted ferric reductase